jgi:hypothetical protein
MTGIIILFLLGALGYVIFQDDVTHLGYRVFASNCEHLIPWDMPCVACHENGRFRR